MSQVTGRSLPPATAPGAVCDVTRNGPAVGTMLTEASEWATPPRPVAVAGGEPEMHRAVAVEPDPVRGRQELGVAVDGRLRERPDARDVRTLAALGVRVPGDNLRRQRAHLSALYGWPVLTGCSP